jgi:pyridoxine 5-phosphate synthase
MARITVVLDDIIKLSRIGLTGEPKPSKAAAVCDLAGAGGVAIRIKKGEFNPEYEKYIKGIKEVLGIPLALIVPPDDRVIEKVLDLSPSMAVLAETAVQDSDYVSRLQVADIIVAIEISVDLDQVKSAAKMKADYIAIDVAPYCNETSLSARVDLLNKISKAAALAERLSIGVILSGPMTLNDVDRLAEIEQVEDFFIGHELIGKAVLFGLEDSIMEFKSAAER